MAMPAINDREKILQCVYQLAEESAYDSPHARQVTRLALRLFDELGELHQLGPADRLRLECAALLHDIGWQTGAKGHHRASMQMILESPLLPFDERERAIIGCIARYHRKSLPAITHQPYAALEANDQEGVSRLAALLRLAEGLDHDHKQRIKDLTCRIRPRKVVVRANAARRSLELAQSILEKSDLFVLVYRRKLEFNWKPLLQVKNEE